MLSSSSLSEASDCTSLRASFSFRFLTIVPSQWYKVDSFYVDLETNYCCRAAVLHFFLARNQGHDDINVLNILARAKTSLGKVTHGANYTIYTGIYSLFTYCMYSAGTAWFFLEQASNHTWRNQQIIIIIIIITISLGYSLGALVFQPVFQRNTKITQERERSFEL